jgi:hypothetical protein
VTTTAELRAFGVDPETARITVTPRSARWRVSRAVGFGLAGYGVMLLAILPPHAVWAMAGLVAGTTFSTLKFLERYTLESFAGACPHCGAEVSSDGSTRLKARSTVTCDACHRASELVVDVPALDAAR